MTIGRPFEPGNRGGGRRVAAKNRISTKLLEALSADFEANGEMAIRRPRVDHLPDYMRLIGNLLPKEIELTATDSRLMELSDAQLIMQSEWNIARSNLEAEQNRRRLIEALDFDLPAFCKLALRIRPKAGPLQTFVLNAAQRRLHEIIEKQRAAMLRNTP